MQKGWIKLHRRIQSHWLYQEKRVFSRYEAWLDLLMMANHKENRILIDSNLKTVKPGQIITSIRKLCDRFSWSNTKVKRFLKLLEQDEMISYKSDTKKTVITIVKYEGYHSDEREKTSQKHNENISEAHQKHTNKNVKECIKNDKELIPYAEIVSYLNEKANKKFKHQTAKTKQLIKARWNEGNRLDDFKQVIDVCCDKWSGQIFSNGQKGDTYLQPSTLFNGKFDERLNWSRKSNVVNFGPKKTKEQIAHEQMLRETGYFE